jgi:ubiquinone biosynthesis protein
LNPDLDLWKTAKPFLERNMSEQLGTRALLRNLKGSIPAWSETLPDMPVLTHAFLEQATTGRLRMLRTESELKQLRREIRNANRRTVSAVIGTGLIVSAAVVYGLDGYAPAMVFGAPLMSWLLAAGGILIVLLGTTDDT